MRDPRDSRDRFLISITAIFLLFSCKSETQNLTASSDDAAICQEVPPPVIQAINENLVNVESGSIGMGQMVESQRVANLSFMSLQRYKGPPSPIDPEGLRVPVQPTWLQFWEFGQRKT